MGEKYIITTVENLMKWEEAESIESCTKDVTVKFIYENMITQISCPMILVSDRGTHFINGTIEVLTKDFMFEHRKTIAYHPQANVAVKSFNKTLHKGITKICNIEKDDWDDKVPTILWAYHTRYRQSIGATPFKLVYGQDVVVPFHGSENTHCINYIKI